MSRSFRRARAEDRELLDEMTLAGIRHWGHDREFPEAYQGLVSMVAGEGGPENHPVFVLEEDAEVVGFFELRDRGEHVELLRMFLRTDLIGKGYGLTLWDQAVERARGMGERMLIMSDPGSVGFYSAMGAHLEKTVEVSPGFALGVFWYDLTG
jgi:GNAT superfamily N-acetyltransferase